MAVNAESAKRDIGSGSRWHNPRHILFAEGSPVYMEVSDGLC